MHRLGDQALNLGADLHRLSLHTVIAHALGQLAAADRVVSLDGGHVVETGTPAELLRTGGAFARVSHQYERARSWRIANHG